MEFPGLQQITGLNLSGYEKEFIQTEYGFGLPYYLRRLDRIMFSGGRVLDAGCGVGQWSIALSQRFEQVECVDLNKSRLVVLQHVADRIGIGNIRIRRGSLEHLPYPDSSFGAVFCYGVIMFTAVERTLGEFFRVVRPGGRVYICLNADGWSRYLIEERGRTDEQARVAGQTTLYSTYWRRAIRSGITPSLHQKLAMLRSLTGKVPLIDILCQMMRFAAERLLWKKGSRQFAQFLLCHSLGGTELWDAVRRDCGEKFALNLLDDVWAILQNARAQPQCVSACAFQPQEFEPLVQAAGFSDFQWAVEGGLVCDWLQTPVDPKYRGTFANDLAVWECLFVKPDTQHVVVSVERHIQAARAARHTPLYLGPTSSPILSNCSRWTYPRHLLAHAEDLAERLGGNAYLRQLSRLLTEEAKSEEDAVRRIIGFVQRAVFRDPVSQPLTEAGAIPDALTSLLCSRGRCGHIATILLELFKPLGFEARLRQLPSHVIAEVRIGNRWVIADADAFKNGVIPVNRQGQLISLDEIFENPFQLDRFPTTGWFIRPDSIYTRDVCGHKISGYVDALTPDQRGYVSGHYVRDAKGYPPSVPAIVRFKAAEGRFHLEWTASRVRDDRLMGYRVSAGTTSRGWTYDDPGDGDDILQSTATDIISADTLKTEIEGDFPPDASRLVASVTAYSSRIEKEPETYFWPSDEAFCELQAPGETRTPPDR
ncbi:MAG: methyltransferase domain-containing protein [Nitrospirae bacterium]|nr:methyltransferase domain-containing protein [Nitrospirota bacterium]